MNQSKRKFLAALLAGLMLAGVAAQGAVFADETGVGTTVTTTADETTLTTDPADPATGGENDQEDAAEVEGEKEEPEQQAPVTGADAGAVQGVGTDGEAVVAGAPETITTGKELQAALDAAAAEDGTKEVTLTQNVAISSTITIPAGVTLDGGDCTISISDSVTWPSEHGKKYMVVASSDATVQNLTIDAGKNAYGCLQFYMATGGKIQNVTLTGAKELGLNVNASTVTASGTITYEGNGWGNGINVSWGSNIPDVESCSFDASGATLNGVSMIYTDNSDVEHANGASITIKAPENYIVVADPDNVPTNINKDKATIYTKKDNVPVFVGSEGYFSLQTAIDEADAGATIKLNQDVQGNFTIPKEKNIILDLNGCILNGGTAPRKAALTNHGTVTIQDSVGNGTIKRSDEGSTGGTYYTILNEGTMTIKSGNISNNSGSPDKWSGSSLICNGLNESATLNIEGGTLQQNYFIVVKNDEHGILNISGGIIKSNTQAVQNWGTANITGGDLTGAVTTWTYFSTNATTNITGGTIVGDIQATKLIYDNTPVTNRPTVKISGNANIQGKFKVGTQNGSSFAPNNTDANFTITGGTFTNNPSAFVPDGYEVTNSNGSYTVAEEEDEPYYPPVPDYDDDDDDSTGSTDGSTTDEPAEMPENGFGTDENGDTFFYEDGELVTGWVKDGDTWYYMDKETGAMNTEDWVQVNGTWYNFDEDGSMNTGWEQVNGTWYYMAESGAMTTGWQKVDGSWYYMQTWGGMTTGWQQVNGTWYYLKESGAMATGWQQIGGTWYYLKDWGGMATGWQEVNGKWYYFYASGAMAANTTIDGYTVDASGAWVE